MNKKFKLGLLLFLIGFAGVLSTLTLDIPLPEKTQELISQLFTPWQFKLLSLINPTILLAVAVLVGTLLYDQVHFRLPVLESLVYPRQSSDGRAVLQHGAIGGSFAGILITLTAVAFNPVLPAEFLELGATFRPTWLVRFLYGGLTEEILIRFGLMTLLVWLFYKVFGTQHPLIYWIGLVLSAIVFGLAHLPAIYTMIGPPTPEVLAYIVVGNALGGLVFGWLYWKKGLESAMVGHIVAHIVMILGESVFNF